MRRCVWSRNLKNEEAMAGPLGAALGRCATNIYKAQTNIDSRWGIPSSEFHVIVLSTKISSCLGYSRIVNRTIVINNYRKSSGFIFRLKHFGQLGHDVQGNSISRNVCYSLPFDTAWHRWRLESSVTPLREAKLPCLLRVSRLSCSCNGGPFWVHLGRRHRQCKFSKSIGL